MTRRTLGDLLNPAAYLERLRAEADLRIKSARLDLDAQIESAKLEQGERHHSDRMSLEVRKVESGELQAAGQLALGRDELDFKRESAALTAHTSLEVARTQNVGALELSQQNHNQALEMFREQLHGSIVEKTGNAVNESLLSALRRGEDSNRAFTSAMADIIKARKLAEISTAQTDHAERNRTAEREHEINMEVLKAQLAQGVRDNGLDEADLMRRFAEWMAAEQK